MLKNSIDQVLTSSAETLSLHVSLLDQQLQLQARLKVCSSAVQHYRNQFLEYRTASDVQLSTCFTAQLHEIQAKYDKLAAQVSEEDPLLHELHDHFGGNYPTYRLDDVAADLCKLRPYLWPDNEDDT